MLLETLAVDFRRARSVNETSNGYVSLVPTTTEPSGDAGTATGASIIDLANPSSGQIAQNGVMICPYAIGSNNNTFSFRVVGWRRAKRASAVDLWVPVVLVEYACTISSVQVGVAGAAVLATELFADTITLTGTTGNANVSEEIVSPANDTIAHVLVDMKGSQKLQLQFTTGGSATSCNALLALL